MSEHSYERKKHPDALGRAGAKEQTTKYKHVYPVRTASVGTKNIWLGSVQGQCKNFPTDREAAKWVDLQLIRKGKEPVNILKRKK